MGNDKEDSGFGFKDRAKAEETLRLLEQHEPNYRRLTVRGLLGRAKRVLSLTKAEDKIKNIKEAMEVFETWLADLDGKKETKEDKKEKKADKKEKKEEKKEDRNSDKSSDEDLPSESVPGLGFKDAAAARGSLEALAGRDPDYQLLAVKGLVGRAKRVLTCTKDETKLSNIKEAMAILEDFIDAYDTQHLSRQNCPYLSVGHVRTAHTLAGDTVTEQQKAFLSAYNAVRGEYKRLRNVATEGSTWDVIRNKVLKELKEKNANAKLFNEKDEPTLEHIEYLLWAFSPEAAKLKKQLKETTEPLSVENLQIGKQDRKRRSSGNEGTPSKKKKE